VSHLSDTYPPITDADRARQLAIYEQAGLGKSSVAAALRRPSTFNPMISAGDYRALTPDARAAWNRQWLEQLIAFDGDLARMDPLHHSNSISAEAQRQCDHVYDAARDAEGHR
jgi:hypothetical protein